MSTTTADTAGWRPTVPANPVRATAAGKVAALLALVCVAAHIPVLLTHLPLFPGTSLLMLALAVPCVACARHLWTKPTIRDWSTAGVLAVGMLVLHSMLMLSMTHGKAASSVESATATGHHHVSAALPTEIASMQDGPVEVLFFAASALALIQVAMAAVIVLPVTLRRPRATRVT